MKGVYLSFFPSTSPAFFQTPSGRKHGPVSRGAPLGEVGGSVQGTTKARARVYRGSPTQAAQDGDTGAERTQPRFRVQLLLSREAGEVWPSPLESTFPYDV